MSDLIFLIYISALVFALMFTFCVLLMFTMAIKHDEKKGKKGKHEKRNTFHKAQT